MKRWEHTLKPNKRRTVPTEWVFFDTESDSIPIEGGTKLVFRFGYAEHCRYVREKRTLKTSSTLFFDEPESFISFLESCVRKQTTLYVVAHNITHDVCTLDLLRRMTGRGWEIDSIYEEQATVIIRLHRGTSRVVLIDSLNWFRGKLADFAPLVGEKKVDVDFDCPDTELLKERCITDVVILRKMVDAYIRFVQDNDFGDLRLTAASQAFSAFRHRFYRVPIRIHNDERVLALERASYKGGMVRCWRVGEFNGEFYQLDVNSMYPYVMSRYAYPVRMLAYREKVKIEELRKLCNWFCLIADMTVKPKRPAYLHRTVNGITVYPTYEFRDVFTTPEIEDLLREDAILKVHRVVIYKASDIFREYVYTLYEMRMRFKEEGNKVWEYLCKVMLNSLYGKFGARAKRIIPRPDLVIPGRRIHYLLDIGQKRLRGVYYFSDDEEALPYTSVDEGEAFNSFPAIAAHVTAYARLHLFGLVEKAGLENAYYSDTDSIIVNREGYERLSHLIHPTMLGMLKEEGKAEHLIIRSRKDYLFGDKRVLKGIPEVSRAYDTNVLRREVWPSIRTFYTSGSKREYVIREQVIHLNRHIYDGYVWEDGIVIPFTFPPPYDPSPLADPLLLAG
jgi:hypothetical protein